MIRNCILLLLVALSYQGFSQAVGDVTTTHLLKNAQVVSRPGDTPTLKDILIKDGVISRVGRSITPPFDAKVIDLDSMYVYAGFVDPYSHTGAKKPESKEEPPKVPGRATLHQSGVRPQVVATSQISLKESSIDKMNKQGFGVSNVVPHGRMLPGQTSIISLHKGASVDDMVIMPTYAVAAQLTGASRAAPATVIGVMAKYRDLLHNAKIARDQRKAFTTSPSGMKRPSRSAELDALIPVVNGESQLFFAAKTPKSILRALTLQKEHQLKMVLCEVKNLTPIIKQIKSSGNSVLLSLELPKAPKEKKDEKEEKKEKDNTAETKDQEMEGLAKKKDMAYQQRMEQGNLLEKNNIPFAFSYQKVKPTDILPNIKRLIEGGMSEKSALAALTTSPADILGIGQIVGTVDQGKLANLVVTDKPLFEEKTKITYVITDGHIRKAKEKKKAKKSTGVDTGIPGTWSYEVVTPDGTQSGTMDITKDGDKYAMVVTDNSDGEKTEAKDVTVEDKVLKATMAVDMGQMVDLSFDLTFNADTFEGTVTVPGMGSFEMTGTKDQPE